MQNQPDERVLYLSAEINNDSVGDICKQILAFNEADRKGMEKFRNYAINPIELHVQSFGGSVYDMWALIDIIEASNTPIITYCNGYCMSAAAFIFLAGHIRCMYKHSTIMLHQMSCWNVGKINDLVIEQKQLDEMHKIGIKYIKKHTKLGKDFFKKYDSNKEDIYFDAKKALKAGICDQIVERTSWREVLLEQLEEEQEKDKDSFGGIVDDE